MERVLNYLEIEIINFVIGTNYKFVIKDLDKKIQKVKSVLFVTAAIPSCNNVLPYISLAMSSKYFKLTVHISSNYLQFWKSNFAIATIVI